jgi:hypothetical protein
VNIAYICNGDVWPPGVNWTFNLGPLADAWARAGAASTLDAAAAATAAPRKSRLDQFDMVFLPRNIRAPLLSIIE